MTFVNNRSIEVQGMLYSTEEMQNPQMNTKIKEKKKGGRRSTVWRKAHSFHSHVEYRKLVSNVLLCLLPF